MEKLSSILPSKARITSVDTEGTAPARPGAPGNGRPAGTSAVRDRAIISAQAKEMAAKETLLGRNGKEASRAKSVEEINRKFFETRLQKPAMPELPLSEEIGENLEEVVAAAPQVREQAVAAYETPQQAQPSLSVEV